MSYEKYNPLVSIVLPTYNGSIHIRESIESCLNQSHRNIELIIVNDASTDETTSIIKEYQSKDNRVKVLHHSINKKLPAALNTGFSVSTGDYLTWTSDDNLYDIDAISKMLNFLIKNDKYSFVYSNYNIFVDDINEFTLIRNPYLPELLFGNIIGACFLYTRNVYLTIGDYCEQSFLSEDYEYWVRIFEQFNIAHLDRVLYFYRCHNNSLTNTYSNDTIIKKTISSRKKLLKIFVEQPSKDELNYFLRRYKLCVLDKNELFLSKNLFEKIILKNKKIKKLNNIELKNIIFIKFRKLFRKSSRVYGVSLWSTYWKYKYRPEFNYNEFVFFVLLFLSWIKYKLSSCELD